MVVYGYCPEQLTTSSVIPIPKGCNVNQTDSNNYRGIGLSAIFVKIFDHIVLMRYQSKLVTFTIWISGKMFHKFMFFDSERNYIILSNK